MGTRIAMWSGPRNISTAMMRSWENRPDTFVCDEPLYAYYLERTALDHPGASEIIDRHESDWRRVVDWLAEQKANFARKAPKPISVVLTCTLCGKSARVSSQEVEAWDCHVKCSGRRANGV